MNKKTIVKEGPYFRKYLKMYQQSATVPEGYYQYEFFSALNLDARGMQIYLHYFPSIFKRKAYRQGQDKYLSELFKIFLKIFLLKRIINPQTSVTSTIMNVVSDILQPTVENEKESWYSKELKSFLTNLLDSEFKSLYKNTLNKSRYCYHELADEGFEKIDSILKELEIKLSDPEQLKLFLKGEEIPEEIIKRNMVKQYVMSNFQSIRNFKFLAKSSRKQAIDEMIKKNANSLQLKMQYIMKQTAFINRGEVKKEEPIKYAEGNDNQLTKDDHSQHCVITMPKFSIEQHPIITKISNYLTASNMSQSKFALNPKRASLMEDIIKDLVKITSNYYSKTGVFYPSISLSDIYFDQKKLKPHISEQKLILEGVGYNEDMFNHQMKIIYGMSPKGVQNEKCHLEYYKRVHILLNKISYHPYKQRKDEYFQYNQYNDQLRKELELAKGRDPEQIEQRILADKYQNNMKELHETVHVWRLIVIFYYILKLEKLNMKLYNDYNEKGQYQVKEDKSKPFYLQKYRNILKSGFEKMITGDISIPRLLYYSKSGQPDISVQNSEWSFSLKSLRNMYNFTEKDSLMEPLQFIRIKGQFYVRMIVIKQFNNILTQECFKKLKNVKKYLLTLFVNGMEYLYEIQRVIQQSKRRKHSRSQIISSFAAEYKSTRIDADFFLKTVQVTGKKLRDYNNRDKKEVNKMYIEKQKKKSKSNINIFEQAVDLMTKIDEAERLELSLKALEVFFQANKKIKDEKHGQQIKQKQEEYAVKLKELEDICITKYNKGLEYMQRYVQEQFIKFEPEESEKKDKKQIITNQYYQYLHRKLFVSVKIFLTLNQDNWKDFQNFYWHLLIEDKGMSNRIPKITNENCNQNQFKLYFQNLYENLSILQNNFCKKVSASSPKLPIGVQEQPNNSKQGNKLNKILSKISQQKLKLNQTKD